MTFDKTLFETYEVLTDATVEMGTRATTKVAERGSRTLRMQCGSSFGVRKLKNVLNLPSFEYSLLSVRTLDKNRIQTTFGDGKCGIQNDSLIVATGSLNGSSYVVNTKSISSWKDPALVTTTVQLWHERMGHVDKRGITQMDRRGIVHGLKFKSQAVNSICEGCVKGKAHRSPIPKERTSVRASAVLDRVHSDVCGPVETFSIGKLVRSLGFHFQMGTSNMSVMSKQRRKCGER